MKTDNPTVQTPKKKADDVIPEGTDARTAGARSLDEFVNACVFSIMAAIAVVVMVAVVILNVQEGFYAALLNLMAFGSAALLCGLAINSWKRHIQWRLLHIEACARHEWAPKPEIPSA